MATVDNIRAKMKKCCVQPEFGDVISENLGMGASWEILDFSFGVPFTSSIKGAKARGACLVQPLEGSGGTALPELSKHVVF